MPVMVYKDHATGKYLAWDGQHTVILLWYIATKILGEDPDDVTIPIVVYSTEHKSDMRFNFVVLNGGEGKMALDDIDKIEQEVFGVRVDGNTHPAWLTTEKKQEILEKYDLFITHEKFGDDTEINAISRVEEFKKMSTNGFDYLCHYLSYATNGNRHVEPKEMVMMGRFFERCNWTGIKVDDTYIADLAATIEKLWEYDFSPAGKFWTKAKHAYYAWHDTLATDVEARFDSNGVKHGFPFLIAQLRKSFAHRVPDNDSPSEFRPLVSSLA
jgi:hypothetical protein